MAAPQGALPEMNAKIMLREAGPETKVEGVSVAFDANQTGRGSVVLTAAMRIQQVKAMWKNMEGPTQFDGDDGDHGWLVIDNPAAHVGVQGAVAQGGSQVTVAAGAGAYFDPQNGAAYIEFWNDTDDNVVEMQPIASVAGDVVTLGEPTAEAHSADCKVRPVIKSFSPLHGTHNIDGGFCMVDNGACEFGYEHEVTAAVPAGLALSCRFKANGVAAARRAAVNFQLREPESE